MTYNILLYGATGFSGRLIAAEMNEWNAALQGPCRMILAGRDANRLKPVADELDMDYRIFGLDERKDVRAGLRGIDVVLNAAGPFAWTAERLAKVALEVECHYVDINGEIDVYKRLDDLDVHALQREVALVCGAGFWAGASDCLLDRALDSLPQDTDVGAIRIAMSRIVTFSRGSVETVWRSLREQVTIVRKAEVPDGHGGTRTELVLWHEPVGKLERTFDFAGPGSPVDTRVASAVNLVDTLTARLTAARHNVMPGTIESYVETGLARRLAYQVGSMMAPLAAMPLSRALAQQALAVLSDGPAVEEREAEKHIIVIEIEDAFRTLVIDWRAETPNVYDFTARLAVAVANAVAPGEFTGWRTPAEVLRRLNDAAERHLFRDVSLHRRRP